MQSIRTQLLVALVLSGCTQANVRTTEVSPADDLPNRPDLVTVVPFQPYTGAEGFILLSNVELDGMRGTVVLDTGSPVFYLNGRYVQSNDSGEIDTVRAGTSRAQMAGFVRTMRIGTLVQHFDAGHTTLIHPGIMSPGTNALIVPDTIDRRLAQWHQPVLGLMGLVALTSFETILDYRHRRLILIRLDSAGHRLIDVPAYTPVRTIPLTIVHQTFLGVSITAGGRRGVLALDTGMPSNVLNVATRKGLGIHLASTTQHDPNGNPVLVLDTLVVGGQVYSSVPFGASNGWPYSFLGYPFLKMLSQEGAVGLNLRTGQLIVYRTPRES